MKKFNIFLTFSLLLVSSSLFANNAKVTVQIENIPMIKSIGAKSSQGYRPRTCVPV